MIAVEQRKRAVGAGKGVEGDGEAVIVGDFIVVAAQPLFLFLHAVFEESGFDAGVARETPMGGGELMDEIGFGFGLREEVVQIIAELGLVLIGGFVEEDDRLGGESVNEGVEGGFLRGASGFGGVGAGGGDCAGRGRHGFAIRV